MSKEQAEQGIKTMLNKAYAFVDGADITNGEIHFDFLFDDETGGSIEVRFASHAADLLGIEISGHFPWDVVEIYNLVERLLAEGDGGTA